MNNIWKILKIKPTTDLKAIKKAYAEQVRTCHQEDEPERWQQLHDAFKAASNYARRYGEGNRRPEIMVERDAVQKPVQEEREPEQLEDSEVEYTEIDIQISQNREQEAGEAKKEKHVEVNEQQEEDYAKYFERISKKEELSREDFLEWMFKELEYIPELGPLEQRQAWKNFFEEKRMEEFWQDMSFWNRFTTIVLEGDYDKFAYEYIGKALFMVRINLGTEIPYELKIKIEELSSEVIRRGHGVTLEDIKRFEIHQEKSEQEEQKSETEQEDEPKNEPEPEAWEAHRENFGEEYEALRANFNDKKERWQKQVREQLWAISKRPKAEHKQAWQAFFEHWYTDNLLNEMNFWDLVEEVLRGGKFRGAIYAYMENLLNDLLAHKEELDEDIKARIQTIAWKCQWMVGVSKFFQGLRLLVCAFLAVMLLRTPVSNWLEENTKGQYGSADIYETFAAYMNEKYDTTDYGAEQFFLEELVLGDKSAGYRIMQKESEGFVGYVIIDRDSGAGFNKLVCMDNLEVSVIEATLLEAEKSYFAESFIAEDVAYHTKFSGDESAFVENEMQMWNETFSEYSK